MEDLIQKRLMRISKGTSKKPAQSLGTTEMPEEVVAVALENCERDSVAALAQDAVSVSMRVEQDQGRVSERYTELAAEYDRLDGEVRKLEQEIGGIEARRWRINEFIRAYKASGEEFSEDG